MEVPSNPTVDKPALKPHGSLGLAKTPLYSPWQASAFFFIGGPFASTYFLYANFNAVGKPVMARVTAFVGVLLTTAFIPAAVYLFNSIEIGLVQVANFFITRWIVGRFQMKEADIEASETYEHQPNRKVAKVNIVAFLAFLALYLIVLINSINRS